MYSQLTLMNFLKFLQLYNLSEKLLLTLVFIVIVLYKSKKVRYVSKKTR